MDKDKIIYVATYGYDREGDKIIGVFDSYEKAQAACDSCDYGDVREVKAYKLNESVLE